MSRVSAAIELSAARPVWREQSRQSLVAAQNGPSPHDIEELAEQIAEMEREPDGPAKRRYRARAVIEAEAIQRAALRSIQVIRDEVRPAPDYRIAYQATDMRNRLLGLYPEAPKKPPTDPEVDPTTLTDDELAQQIRRLAAKTKPR